MYVTPKRGTILNIVYGYHRMFESPSNSDRLVGSACVKESVDIHPGDLLVRSSHIIWTSCLSI